MTLGLGCMRLSTEPDRDEVRARAVLDAALDAGITLLDTADAYARDDADVGHNERLIAGAIVGRRVTVVTKGGLERPGGAWVPNGKAKHLADAARASRDRLGVEAIDLYLLHAIDPRTPLATSVRALAKLRDDGIARAIGLSNVRLHELEQALEITGQASEAIDAVELELGPWKLDAIHGGLVAACAQRGIRVLAHRPLGGPSGVKRIARDPVIRAIAKRLDATPVEIVLAWLRSLGVVPLPGATTIATARSAARVVTLDDAAIAALGAHLLDLGAARDPRGGIDGPPREVVMITGMPGAGKSTLAERFVADGYTRLNRDDRGGSLRDLAKALDAELATSPRVVLDNTYPTRASRAQVVAVARRHGAAVRCVIAETSLEDAQHNAVARLIARYGRLLEPAELAREKQIGPGAQFRYRRHLEPPRADEGFSAIEPVVFARTPHAGGRPALVVELDNVVWHGRPRAPDRIELVPGVRDHLAAWARAGHAIVATTWQPEPIDPALDAALAERLGLAIHVARCVHPAGPPICWCRKPLPGLALVLAHVHGLALDASLHVGHTPADRGFALRAGLRYCDVADGWPTPAT